MNTHSSPTRIGATTFGENTAALESVLPLNRRLSNSDMANEPNTIRNNEQNRIMVEFFNATLKTAPRFV